MAHTTPSSISREHLATARAVDQLRRQLGIVFREEPGRRLGAIPIEGLSEPMLAQIKRAAKVPPYLLVSGARLRNLMPGQDPKALAFRIDAMSLTYPDLIALADPLSDTPLPPIAARSASESDRALMQMVKYASLLPALLVFESDDFPEDWLEVSAGDIAAYWASPPLEIVPLVKTALPIAAAENVSIMCFRTRYGTSTHLALLFGELTEQPLVRIHSSCVTGDILGSLRCDCGDQLRMAMDALKEQGGVLLYLHQEGRGIGLANKLRAYALQARGYDTYQANHLLGFEEDERDFSIAAAMLKHLGIKRLRLLTNNPDKAENLRSASILIEECVPLAATPGTHNHAYLDAKKKRAEKSNS